MNQTLKRRTPFHKFSVRVIIYFIGFLTLSLGIRTVIASDLGAGPWDTTSYNLHRLIPMTLGTASFLVQSSVMLLVLAFRRKHRYLLMIIPIIGIAAGIDFWDLVVFTHFDFSGASFALKVILYVSGAMFLSFGLSIIIQSGFPAGVFDEFMLLLMDAFHTQSYLYSRFFVEGLAIVLAVIFGFMAGIGFGQVNGGSVLLVFLLAPLLSLHMRWTGALMYEQHA